MATLESYGREVHSVFQLLGDKENDISLSMSWALAKCPEFLKAVKYFCPVGGNGWPKEPPNYIAFRYYGQLQSIHHIEGYTVSRNMHDEIPEMPDEVWDNDCYIYKLGPAIIPGKTVKTGKIYRNGRVWAMLDTLLTCDTISEARDLTQSRM